jgi:hypothetical protein
MKRGDTFTHARWLDTDHKPLRCVVTRVARGLVYWRPIDGGSPMYFELSKASQYVKAENANT